MHREVRQTTGSSFRSTKVMICWITTSTVIFSDHKFFNKVAILFSISYHHANQLTFKFHRHEEFFEHKAKNVCYENTKNMHTDTTKSYYIVCYGDKRNGKLKPSGFHLLFRMWLFLECVFSQTKYHLSNYCSIGTVGFFINAPLHRPETNLLNVMSI